MESVKSEPQFLGQPLVYIASLYHGMQERGGSNNRELNKGDPPVSSNPHCNTVIESVNTIKYGTRGSELLSIVQLLLTNILIFISYCCRNNVILLQLPYKMCSIMYLQILRKNNGQL